MMHILRSMLVKEYNIKAHTLNLIEQIVEVSLKFTGTGNNILKGSLIPKALRSTINQGVLMEPKGFYKAKDNLIWTRRHLIYRMEKIYTNSTLDRVLIAKQRKEDKKLYIKKTNSP